MRRYRPNRPSRREVRAAIDFYKPHDFDGGAMPETVPPDYASELYKRGICWWTFKGRKYDTPQHICGIPATLRNVMKNSVVTHVNIWLCDKHAGKLKSQGYTVTVVPDPPSLPGGIIKP